MQKVSLWEIYKIFFSIGFQLLGGGYVILPLLRQYIVEERKWITEEELIDYFAVSQCIPGLIAGNIGFLTGYKVRKTLGSIVATLGIATPSFISIILIIKLLSNAVTNPIVQNAFWGVRISVIILIIITIKDMWAKSVNSKFTYAMFFFILLALLLLPVSPTIIIILSAVVALLFSNIRGNKNA